MEDSFIFNLGIFKVAGAVVITWGIMFVLGTVLFLVKRRLVENGGAVQAAFEGTFVAFEGAIGEVLPEHVGVVLPFVSTLWVFIGLANLIGLIPGLSSPTANLSVTASLAFLVYLSVHWFGIRIQGPKAYFKHYLSPSPLLLPFHLISEVSRTLALAIRLFGNIMSLEMAAGLVFLVAGFLVPVPLLMLHVIEAVIQAYLFGILALIYIAGGIHTHEMRRDAAVSEGKE